MDREQDIPFVYENGVLRPEGPVDFPEGGRGIAHIREVAGPGRSTMSAARRRALETIRRIAASGVLNSGGRRLTRDEMHERG
ncbi:MAG TPA: antitoxin family protein [Phycisphaerales bacterium]|nr:antitoxin family protein [Phycisphaerales bacterium]